MKKICDLVTRRLGQLLESFRYPIQKEWHEQHARDFPHPAHLPRQEAGEGAYFGTPVYDLLPGAQINRIVSAIDHAFQRDFASKEIQSCFLEFVQNTHFWILHDRSVQARLSAMPNFAAAVWPLMMRSKMGQAFFEAPRLCDCYKTLETRPPAPWRKLILSTHESRVKSTVSSCSCPGYTSEDNSECEEEERAERF